MNLRDKSVLIEKVCSRVIDNDNIQTKYKLIERLEDAAVEFKLSFKMKKHISNSILKLNLNF